MPPIAKRLPNLPLVLPVTEQRGLGKQGGNLRTMVSRSKDTRLFAVYGYARLLGYDEDFELRPDILEKVEVEDGRIFTLHLRKGHRWSDGAPFTTEDFRYVWEDVALNPELSPSGPARSLRVNDELPVVEVLDQERIRYSWSAPNPLFLPALADTRPLYIYAPSHYLKQFHVTYGDKTFIEQEAKRRNLRNWAALHNRLDDLYRFENPDLPVLQPWVLTNRPPARRYIAKRNPYFHRVDEAGQQLPYIDSWTFLVTSGALISAKAGTGAVDLQARGLNFSDAVFLKQNEKKGKYQLRLWETGRASTVALYPNLNAADAVWRTLLRDVRFRRALSLGVDREEINQVIFSGLGLPGNHSVLPESALFERDNFLAWSRFDMDQANALLDEIGLTERNDEGLRLLPDGRSLSIIVESFGENPQDPDVLELIHDNWLKLGIKLYGKAGSRELLRNRIFAGTANMVIWYGADNGIPNADSNPHFFVPIRQYSYQWPKWGQFYDTSALSGEAVDQPLARDLLLHFQTWRAAKSRDAREDAWRKILKINADQVYVIGLVAKVPQPLVVSDRLRNVPRTGFFNWSPGAEFGVYHPDAFWLAGP
ncbi:ABC transporter substrate-binding protein [Rhodovibrionaceae bacterium A322]